MENDYGWSYGKRQRFECGGRFFLRNAENVCRKITRERFVVSFQISIGRRVNRDTEKKAATLIANA